MIWPNINSPYCQKIPEPCSKRFAIITAIKFALNIQWRLGYFLHETKKAFTNKNGDNKKKLLIPGCFDREILNLN